MKRHDQDLGVLFPISGENGKPVEQTRTVDITGRGNVRVDFTRPRPEK
jgi:hypothetical protein